MHTFNPQLGMAAIMAAILLLGALVLAGKIGPLGGVGFFHDLAPAGVAYHHGAGADHKPRGWARDWRHKLHDKVAHLLAGNANIGKSDDGDGGGGVDTKTLDAEILDTLKLLKQRTGKLDAIEKTVTEEKDARAKLVTEFTEFQKTFNELRKQQIAGRSLSTRRRGQVSDECARHLGGIVLLAALNQERIQGAAAREFAEAQIKEIFGVQQRTALTTSDIPIPTQWQGEVVELVSEFGAARRLGTVFPLGAGVVKLPRLGTDTAFGLIGASGTVTEKSPTIVFVTFTAEKFGGLVRLPSELDEDSVVALGQFLARYAARQIAYIEDYQFFRSTGAGSGSNGSVKGLCESTIDNSKVVQMASTKTKYSDATLANLRAIRATVDAPVLGRARYIMHPTFEQHLAGLNTAGDKPYIANGIQGASLDGFPIEWVDAMPAYSTSANVSKVFVLFGDASYQYVGVRGGVRFDTSKDAAFATDEILVRALERFTIGLMAVGAVSGLETAAS